MAAVLAMLALETGEPPWNVGAAAGAMVVALAAALLRARHTRVFVVIPWAVALAVIMWVIAAPALEERQLVLASSVLAFCEIGIVTAVATLFSSFSSPFLTAVATGMIFIIGRSSDTLGRLPRKVFGAPLVTAGHVLARIFPNLHVYVPARPLLSERSRTRPYGPTWARPRCTPSSMRPHSS